MFNLINTININSTNNYNIIIIIITDMFYILCNEIKKNVLIPI